LLSLCALWQKLIEVLTGIELAYRARIAPGLCLGHFGNIVVHPDAVMGLGCNIAQGVAIGVSGRRGVPILGERVYREANAVIARRLTVRNEAVIAANALVTLDVPPCAVMISNPAQVANFNGSSAYMGAEE
jgi:serine O-acetyltransferase